MTGLLVQYGCGLSAPEGWLNFDTSPTLRLQRIPGVGGWLTPGRPKFPANVRYGDVVRGLPVATGAARAVYCSHVLEHLSLADMRRALVETHRVLAEGGTFRGVLPDLEGLARTYLADLRPTAAHDFMASSLLGVPERPRGPAALATVVLGNSHHLWMWDYKALAAELEAVGFRDIRRAVMGDNGAMEFAAVEDKSRWDGHLGFECRR